LLACSQPELLVLVGLAWIFLAGSGWFVSACQAGSAVGEYGTCLGEGFFAIWGSVWLGEGLSLNFRLYAPLFHTGYLASLFWLRFLGSCGVCFHHGSLSVDAMDSISLGEALSPMLGLHL
jgi:hypothetical protein